MGNPVVSGSLIGVLATMVGIVMVRRQTPKAIELAVWTLLIWVCVLTVTSSKDQQARALTGAAAWAASSVLGTVVGAVGRGALQWVEAARFAIADWVVLLFGADLLALALVSVDRRARGWVPRVRLRDWMELPVPGKAQAAPAMRVVQKAATTPVQAAPEVQLGIPVMARKRHARPATRRRPKVMVKAARAVKAKKAEPRAEAGATPPPDRVDESAPMTPAHEAEMGKSVPRKQDRQARLAS